MTRTFRIPVPVDGVYEGDVLGAFVWLKVPGLSGKVGVQVGDVEEMTPVPPAMPVRDSRVGFMTVAEVAENMRVSKMTVYRLVRDGELPAVRVGRSLRLREKSVQDYLNGAPVRQATRVEVGDG